MFISLLLLICHIIYCFQGINFTTFTLHMGVGVLFVSVQTYFQLRYIFRDMNTLRHSVPRDILGEFNTNNFDPDMVIVFVLVVNIPVVNRRFVSSFKFLNTTRDGIYLLTKSNCSSYQTMQKLPGSVTLPILTARKLLDLDVRSHGWQCFCDMRH